MARIAKVLRWVNKGDYATVYVRLEDGLECSVYIGGAVETFFSNGQAKAHVRRAQSRGKIVDKLKHSE